MSDTAGHRPRSDLIELAAQQAGVVVTSQATRLGYGRAALQEAVSRRELIHLGRSIYALPEGVDARARPGEQAEQRHRLLCRGLLLVYSDAVLAGRSAVLARGLPVWSTDLGQARLERPVEHQVQTQVARVRPRSGTEVETSELGPCVPVATAVVQLATDDGMPAGVVAADAALHLDLTTADELELAVERVRGTSRSSAAVAMPSHVDGRSESPGETRLRVLCSAWGVRVVPQVAIVDGRGRQVARVDLLVDGTRVVLEFDGAVKYADGGLPALMAEKRREDRLRALGYTVVRVTWADLDRPATLLGRIRRALALAG